MEKEEQQISHRLSELASLCFYRNIPVFSDFLTLKEQEIFLSTSFSSVSHFLEGGYPEAERKIACFFPEGYEKSFVMEHLKLIKIAPVSEKFAVQCSHRDFLGAILNLGIDRGKLGDLILDGNICYGIVKPPIEDFLCRELSLVRRNPVTVSCQPWQTFSYRPKFSEIRGTVASVRLDSVVALCCSISRSRAAQLCREEKVFVNGSCISSVSYVPKEGQILSIRGTGKFKLDHLENQTKKGRQFLVLLRYE